MPQIFSHKKNSNSTPFIFTFALFQSQQPLLSCVLKKVFVTKMSAINTKVKLYSWWIAWTLQVDFVVLLWISKHLECRTKQMNALNIIRQLFLWPQGSDKLCITAMIQVWCMQSSQSANRCTWLHLETLSLVLATCTELTACRSVTRWRKQLEHSGCVL